MFITNHVPFLEIFPFIFSLKSIFNQPFYAKRKQTLYFWRRNPLRRIRWIVKQIWILASISVFSATQIQSNVSFEITFVFRNKIMFILFIYNAFVHLILFWQRMHSNLINGMLYSPKTIFILEVIFCLFVKWSVYSR